MGIITRIYEYASGRDTSNARREILQSNLETSREKILEQVLTGQAPGNWATDHYRESQKYDEFVYIAIKTIANQMLQLTVETELEESHPAWGIINQPNAQESRALFDFKRAQQAHLTGNVIVWGKEDDSGMLDRRLNVPVALTSPTREGFRLSLSQAATNAWAEVPTYLTPFLNTLIPYDEVQLIRFPSPLFVGDGTSPVSAASKWIDVSNAIGQAWFSVNSNSLRPGGVVTEDSTSELSKDDRERVRNDLRARYGGPQNAGLDLFLPKGLNWQPWGQTGAEMDNRETFVLLRDAILAAFGVTPIAAGILEAGNRSAYYAALIQFVDICIQPFLDLLGEEDTLYFRRYWSDIPDIKYRAKKIIDPDIAKEMSEIGCFTYNEIREAMGYAKSDEPWGEDRAFPVRETIRSNEAEANARGAGNLDSKPSNAKGDTRKAT